MSDLVRSGIVLNMMDRLSQNQYPACALVQAYWQSLKPKNGLPKRSDIDPRGIEDALNYAFILESIGTGIARIRIAGMHLNELFGMEVRGMPISSLIAPPSRDTFSRVLVGVLNSPSIMTLSLTPEGQMREAAESHERMLLLPMVDEKGQTTRVLGCLETRGPVKAPPQRFEIANVVKHAIEAASTTARSHPHLQPVTGFSEAQADFEPAPEARRTKRPDYLRVVKSSE
ncbi:PAS domain-containing protein [Lentibacter sp.]|mgnify:FL=1|uniref:PAS domain-containing protein n=1 Tax=Lentibacter sp. TaxID=2024994 RepID=UPI003F69D95D